FDQLKQLLAQLLDVGFVQNLAVDETHDRDVAHLRKLYPTVNRHQKAPLVERSPAADRSCQLGTPTAKPSSALANRRSSGKFFMIVGPALVSSETLDPKPRRRLGKRPVAPHERLKRANTLCRSAARRLA